jgi:hypothetical protein
MVLIGHQCTEVVYLHILYFELLKLNSAGPLRAVCGHLFLLSWAQSGIAGSGKAVFKSLRDCKRFAQQTRAQLLCVLLTIDTTICSVGPGCSVGHEGAAPVLWLCLPPFSQHLPSEHLSLLFCHSVSSVLICHIFFFLFF